MNKSLLKIAIATLLASGSTALLAGPVTIPNTFTAGDPAVAAEVNGNFTAVKTAVDDNDARVTTNAAGVTANFDTGVANKVLIDANTTKANASAAQLLINTPAIATNTANIAAATSCSSDMVAVGSLCVDLYEASVWDAATTSGNQLGLAGAGGSPVTFCNDNGSDCGASAATPIYALSVAGRPSARITWYQAVQACANVGKRLPTIAEWQMAAQGTPTGTGAGCNTSSTVIANTGASATCVSTSGAAGGTTTGPFDMVGNVWEWVADVDVPPAGSGTEINLTDTAIGYAMGDDYFNTSGQTQSPRVIWELSLTNNAGLLLKSGTLGFRCVR